MAGAVPPLKAMLFVDGTWLYYSLHGHRADDPQRHVMVDKFGRGWQNEYKGEWRRERPARARRCRGGSGDAL